MSTWQQVLLYLLNVALKNACSKSWYKVQDKSIPLSFSLRLSLTQTEFAGQPVISIDFLVSIFIFITHFSLSEMKKIVKNDKNFKLCSNILQVPPMIGSACSPTKSAEYSDLIDIALCRVDTII